MPSENSSFIPKSGVKTVKRSQGTKQIYLLAYISYIVFFSTLFAVIGIYIYAATVERSLAELKGRMEAERSRFAVGDIENVKQLDERLSTAQRLVNESTAPSRLFPDIESIVSSEIRFAGLKYEQLINRQFSLELNGEAEEFNDVIAQELLAQNSPLLAEAEVIEYDYSVGGDGENSGSGEATLTFVFADTRNLSDIAYIAPEFVTTAATTSENVIIESSATGTAEQAGVTEGNQ